MARLRTGPLEPVFLTHGDKCRSCGASIIWAKTRNNRTMPVDALPHVDGTVELTYTDDTRTPTADVLTGMLRAAADPGSLYVAHMATCPNQPRRTA